MLWLATPKSLCTLYSTSPALTQCTPCDPHTISHSKSTPPSSHLYDLNWSPPVSSHHCPLPFSVLFCTILLCSPCTTGGDTGVSDGIETSDSCTMHRGEIENKTDKTEWLHTCAIITLISASTLLSLSNSLSRCPLSSFLSLLPKFTHIRFSPPPSTLIPYLLYSSPLILYPSYLITSLLFISLFFLFQVQRDLLHKCWSERPEDRPTAADTLSSLEHAFPV